MGGSIDMKTLLYLVQASVLSAALSTTVSAQEREAEIIHWWTSAGERAAIEVLSDAFASQGGEWVDNAIADSDLARTTGVNRIFDGDPPTAMQFNTGKQFDSLVTNGLLQNLDDLAEEQAWRDVLPPLLVDAITRDGSFYAVPVNLHGDNWLWVNKAVLEEAGVDIPTSFTEVIEAGPALREAGVTPLALGTRSWHRRIMFNSIILAEAGPETYLAVLGDDDIETVRGEAFRKAAETFVALRDLADHDDEIEGWFEATEQVITGEAAFQLMGDWAKGEFLTAGMVPGEDYECVVLGDHNGFMIGGDVFVFPKVEDPAHKETQLKIASLVMQPDIQLAFNKNKGSLPARVDIDVSSLDACARRGADMLSDQARQIPSATYLVTPDLNHAIDDLVSEFWSTPSMTVDEFVDAYVEAIEYFR